MEDFAKFGTFTTLFVAEIAKNGNSLSQGDKFT